MKITLIVLATLYVLTVVYCFITTFAAANAVRRKIAKTHPELVNVKVPYSLTEKIIKFVPFFIPIFNIFLALCIMFKFETMVEEATKGVITERQFYAN